MDRTAAAPVSVVEFATINAIDTVANVVVVVDETVVVDEFVVHFSVDHVFAAVVVVDEFAAVVLAGCCCKVYFLQWLILFLVFCRFVCCKQVSERKLKRPT